MTNTMYGDVNLVEDYPACCEIIYNLIKEMNVSIDEDLALPLAVGLLTDTGGFAIRMFFLVLLLWPPNYLH